MAATRIPDAEAVARISDAAEALCLIPAPTFAERQRGEEVLARLHALHLDAAFDDVGNVAAFLVSPLASAVTGACVYVDNGLNTMGLASDSKTLLERDS